MAEFKLDTTKFKATIEFVLTNTKKTLPDVLNRAALYTIIGGKGVKGAMQRTPKASRQAILDVPRNIIAGVVMKKISQGQMYLPLGRGAKRHRRVEFNRLIRLEYARRVASIGYTANVGWNNAAIAFGGRGIGSRAKGIGLASEGYGSPATIGNLVARFGNAAPAATVIGKQALQDALDDVSRDMIEHTKQRLQEIFDKAHAL